MECLTNAQCFYSSLWLPWIHGFFWFVMAINALSIICYDQEKILFHYIETKLNQNNHKNICIHDKNKKYYKK